MHLLSEVVVKDRTSRLLLTLKDIGTFYVPWQHWFPTKFVSPDERDELMNKFADYSPRAFSRIAKFNTVQILGRTTLENELLRDEELYDLFTKKFIRGHYTKQAHWRFTPPWWMCDVDPKVLEILEMKKHADEHVRAAFDTGVQLLKESKKRSITRFEDYVAENWNKLREVVGDRILGEQILVEQERYELALKAAELFGICGSAEINMRDKSIDLILDKLDYVRPVRHWTADEIFDSRIYICDIEKPLFNTPEEEVSWFASIESDYGRKERSTIKTLRDTGTDTIPGTEWRIDRYETEGALVDATTAEITREHLDKKTTDAVVAYNAPYDLENTRAAGDFLIGARESDPKVQVALPFFRKDVVRGRLVIDPLPVARVRFEYLPNRKLALVLQEAQGVEDPKAVDYRQLGELERTAKDGNPNHLSQDTIEILAHENNMFPGNVTLDPKIKNLCALTEGRYVGKDVDLLFDMIFSDWFRHHLEDAVWMAEKYKIELSRILHTPNAINDAQERQFFETVGTYMDETMHQKFKRMVQLAQKARYHVWDQIDTQLCPKSTKGMHKEVHKAYVPLGLWFAPHMEGVNPRNQQRRFPAIRQLVDYANQHKADKLRHYTLAQYLEALTTFLTIDFGLADKAQQEYHKTLEQHGLEPEEFGSYHEMWKHQNSPFKLKLSELHIPEKEFTKMYERYLGVMQAESEHGPVHLEQGTITARGISRHPDEVLQFCAAQNITSLDDLANLFKLYAQHRNQKPQLPSQRAMNEKEITKWFGGKHQLSTGDIQEILDKTRKQERAMRRVAGQYNTPFETIQDTLQYRIESVTDYCEEHGLQIIHANGSYVYLTGPRAALERPDAPLVMVDNIPRAYVCINPADPRSRQRDDLEHKIYYPKHNYFEGIKVTDRPSHTLTMFEMECYSELIELLAHGRVEQALTHANASLDELRKTIKEKEQEVEVWRTRTSDIEGVTVDEDNYDPFLTIPKEAFVWHAKSSDTYRVNEYGGITYFTQNKPDGVELQEDDGRQYFEKEIRKGGKLERVYVMHIEHCHPDVKQFYKRVSSRIWDLLEPTIGFTAASEFVNDSQDNVAEFLKH